VTLLVVKNRHRARLSQHHPRARVGPLRAHPAVATFELGMAKNTLFTWTKRGWLLVHRQVPGDRGRVICWVDAEQLDHLRRLRQTEHGCWDRPLPGELRAPRVRPKA
jgi:hypothetical protein